jgi:osmotically inducible protein OsmC
VVAVSLVEGAATITKIELTTVGVVPGIDEVTFQRQATEAKRTCPVSRALASVPEISLEASLAT